MDIILLALLGYVAVMVTVRKRIPVNRQQAIAAPDEHLLVKTWVEANNSPSLPGWKWKCSCGGTGLSTDVSTRSLGSETRAINQFKLHAEGYREANGNKWKDKHDSVVKEFESFKDKCYCKDTHVHRPLERLP